MEFRFFLRRVSRYLRFAKGLLLEQIPGKTTALLLSIMATTQRVASFLIPALLTVSLTLILYTVGFRDFYQQFEAIHLAHRTILLLLCILFSLRFLFTLPLVPRWRARVFNFAVVILVFYLHAVARDIPYLQERSTELLVQKLTLFFGIVVLFFIEASYILRLIYRRGANPALLFVGGFAAFIVIGGFLLLLPNATTGTIHPLDAFFTSASAVCVTGLTVVDTGTAFTTTGKVIILMLIQVGGLGIMTFAGLISFLVLGSSSIQSQLALRDMINSNRMSNAFSFIARVVVVTFTFEAIGVFLIYGTLSDKMFSSESDKIFFSLFHSISAFCNAGFSTLNSGLYDISLRYNYSLHWVIAMLVILGGMGFPIVFNIFAFFRIKIRNINRRIVGKPDREVYTNALQATGKLALATYAILLVAGFVTYFIFERNHTLAEHDGLFAKITTSFFGSVTPRTAGFNTVDLAKFSLTTIMVYLLLMLIGASPGSTGGGIKTTVAAVAFLNMKSIVLGHERTEAFRTEISTASLKRAFAIILLALLVLGFAVLLLSINDAEMGLLRLAFETFSAFSTVGLSLGVTPQLSALGKLVILAVMFIGRVGALTLLFAVVTRSDQRPFKYPSEEIMF